MNRDPLSGFHAAVQDWFRASFPEPTGAQKKGWPPILGGRSTLLLAPTGSGKTLAAFLAAIDRLMFTPEPAKTERLRVLYISPLKALGVDVERNLRAPIAGIAGAAARLGIPHRIPTVAIRSGDTPSDERAKIARTPPDILITTPESLYLLLTSQAAAMLSSIETVIVDEIHAVASSKRGAHLFLSLERLEALRRRGASAAAHRAIGHAAPARGDRAPARRGRGFGAQGIGVDAAGRRDRGRRRAQRARHQSRGSSRRHGSHRRGRRRRFRRDRPPAARRANRFGPRSIRGWSS